MSKEAKTEEILTKERIKMKTLDLGIVEDFLDRMEIMEKEHKRMKKALKELSEELPSFPGHLHLHKIIARGRGIRFKPYKCEEF